MPMARQRSERQKPRNTHISSIGVMAWKHEEQSEAVRLVYPYCRVLEETRDGTGSFAPSPALHGVELTA